MTIKSRSAAASAVVVLALALAACGGSTTAQAPAPATTTVAVADTGQEASQAYLRIVTPSNARLDVIRQRLTDAIAAEDAPALAAALADLADEERAFQRQLVRVDFPPDVQPTADDLTRALGQAAAASDQFASDLYTPANAADFRRALAEVSSSVEIMRARLGLPPPRRG